MHRVNEIMSQDVVRIAPTDSIRHAAQLMERYDIGALPVCDNNRLVGMVTDRDLAVRAISVGKPPETRIQEVASDRVVFRGRFAGRDPALHGRCAVATPAGRRSRQAAGRDAVARGHRDALGRPGARRRREHARRRVAAEADLMAHRRPRAILPAGRRSRPAPHHRNGPSRQGNDGRPPRQPSCFVTRTILSASSRTSTGLHR